MTYELLERQDDPLTAVERADLKPGHFAKVVFKGSDFPERMWIEITGRMHDDDVFIGRLTNEPDNDIGAVLGDLVKFRPRHVVEVR